MKATKENWIEEKTIKVAKSMKGWAWDDKPKAYELLKTITTARQQ